MPAIVGIGDLFPGGGAVLGTQGQRGGRCATVKSTVCGQPGRKIRLPGNPGLAPG